MRTSKGCWTCRVRRKKCDEVQPICRTCAALHITCFFDPDSKPDWMDAGTKQEEMAEQLKREVKEKARQRREGRVANISDESVSGSQASTTESPQTSTLGPFCDLFRSGRNDKMDLSQGAPNNWAQRGADCELTKQKDTGTIPFGRSDTVLFMFYLERLHPFFYPFYCPSLLQGGKSWLLEMMISSPVIRQATICQSSHFFSLAQGSLSVDLSSMVEKSTNLFGLLRISLQIINGSGVAEHIHGAVRVMASIMQVQRFDIALVSFQNWGSHLKAALALFKQIIDCAGQPGRPNASFNAVLNQLGPSSCGAPSAEQAAFRFSTALLIMDSVVASTVLQEQPGLYEYHCGLLGNGPDGTSIPPIDFESVLGIKGWAISHIAEVAAIDAWKRQCKMAGNLDVMELARRATVIKDSLLTHIRHLDNDSAIVTDQDNKLFQVFTPPDRESSLVTRVWAHSGLIYLSIVVSGWQPANIEVRYLVNEVLELLKNQSSPALLRTMIWPFFVAGCLAEPSQESQFRAMVEGLQPPSVFGVVHKALELMENVWRNRGVDATDRDLAMCLKYQGDLVLLV
jgi:hypothetical protein